MKRTFGKSKQRATSSVAILGIIVLVLGFFAIRHDGVQASDVRVNDGTVWVSNQALGLMARMNVDAEEFDTRLSVQGEDLDILQSGYAVLSTGPNGYRPADTALGTLQPLVELRAGSVVALGGDRVAIAFTDGRVWVLTIDQARSFSPDSLDPVVAPEGFNGAPVLAVSEEGVVYALLGSTLYRIPRSENTAEPIEASQHEIEGLSPPDQLQMSVIGDENVILDRARGALLVGTDADEVALSEHGLTALDTAKLQMTSAESDVAVVATSDQLAEVPLGRGDARLHPVSGNGTPVQPAHVRGCAYGAWHTTNTTLRSCGGAETEEVALTDVDPQADLSFRVNRDLIVLNDQKLGMSWMVADNFQLVNEWEITQTILTDNSKKKEEEVAVASIENIQVDRTQENLPPTAQPDSFGVRPGAKVVLPVLRNDTDPDGDLLTATLQGEQPALGQISQITGGTQLQIDVSPQASGQHTFTYQADDGRGGTDTALVTLNVIPDGENEAPTASEQGIPAVQVGSGRQVSINVLPYYQDPEGDSFYLALASATPENVVTFTPDGTVTFRDDGTTLGEKTVDLVFQDEHGGTGEGSFKVQAMAEADLPPITSADHLSVPVGHTATVHPLKNDINPQGGNLQLMEITPPTGVSVSTDLVAGAVQVTGETVGTYYLDYTAVAGAQPGPGLIRVDVIEPSTENLKPVVVDDIAMVLGGSSQLVDPLQNDRDPTGGLLVVQSVAVPEGRGIQASVINHHLVRVEVDPYVAEDPTPVPVTYVASNGIESAEGTIRVMPSRRDTQFANPVGVMDQATVRSDDAVIIDALANDSSPTESEMYIKEVVADGDGTLPGRVEVIDNKIRFAADPDAPASEATLKYTIIDEMQRIGAATIKVRIVPQDTENRAPRPQHVEARTVSGRTITIPIPTSGVDPDGDSSLITGITSPAPSKGTIVAAVGDHIIYEPYEDAVGTDIFGYQMVDRFGAIGTAEVQVGIAPVPQNNTPPVTRDDVVEVKPGRVIDVQVLANDTDSEGDPLSVNHADTAPVEDLEIRQPAEGSSPPYVTAVSPEAEGTYTIQYGASDGRLTTPGTIIMNLTADAEVRAPIARDDYVAGTTVMDPPEDGIVVDLLENDVDPDGSVSTLEIEFPEPHDNVQDRGGGNVLVTPADQTIFMRYVITDEDDLSSSGYLRVPGMERQPPTWIGGTLEVQAGEELSIDLNDRRLVEVRTGASEVKIIDPTQIAANNSDGGALASDESTVTYRSRADFSGQDTLTVPVTDGEPGDEQGAVGTLVIPLLVTATDEQEENVVNEPPSFQGTVLTTEVAGDPATVDLDASAQDPEGDPLEFSLGTFTAVEGLSISLEGSVLTGEAGARVPRDTIVSVPVSVTDGNNDPVQATVQVRVVASRAPLIQTQLDLAQIDAGKTDTIDVLANDSNPFPDGERSIVSYEIMAGSGDVNLVGDQLQVTPSSDFHGTLVGMYAVDDMTKDPARQVQGEFRVEVAAPPDPPSTPRIIESGDEFVTLEIIAGNENGAQIEGYTIRGASGTGGSWPCTETVCTINGLTNGVPVTFIATATNRAGESEPSPASPEVMPDVKPEKMTAPTVTRGDSELTVNWMPPENRGSAIAEYQVTMIGPGGQTGTKTVDGGTTQLVWTGLRNGNSYTVHVRAKNQSDMWSDPSDSSIAEHPAGAPFALRGTPTADATHDNYGGAVTVTWPTPSVEEANGEPITAFHVTASTGETMRVEGGQRSARFTDLDPNASVAFTVTAENSVGRGQGPSPASNALVPYSIPETVSGVKASLPDPNTGNGPNGRVNVSWKAADNSRTSLTEYVVSWNGGSKTVPASATSTQITGLTNGTSYRFSVQARNAHTNGEVSAASAAVVPYTKPDVPIITTSTSVCSSATACSVTVTVNGNVGNGGKGPNTLRVWIDGKQQQVSGTSFKLTQAYRSASTHKIEAEVTNGGKLVSGRQSKSVTARTYVPPNPKLDPDSVVWGPYVTDRPEKCDSLKCRRFGFTISGFTPHSAVTVTVNNENRQNDGLPDWGTYRGTADANGKFTHTWGPTSYFFGYKDALIFKVDGKEVGRTYWPG